MRLTTSPKTVADGTIFGSNNKILDNHGNINANSKVELAATIIEIANAVKRGELMVDEPESQESAKNRLEIASENRAALREAYYDQGGKWAELGAAITMDISQRVEREGFMRSILEPGELLDGSIPRIRVKQRNVTAVATKGLAQVYPQYIRESFIPADEFYITAQPRIEEKDLVQSNGDLLDDKYFEGLESILVTEDRVVVDMLRLAGGLSNDIVNFSGTFTPAIYATVKQQIDGWRIPAGNVLIAMDLMTDIMTGATYSTWFDPISKWEIIKTGRLGTLLGLTLITDGFRDPELRVLNDGEFFILGTPEYLGGYTERGPVQSRPVDEFDKFVPSRGWSMYELISIVVANSRAVARGQKI